MKYFLFLILLFSSLLGFPQKIEIPHILLKKAKVESYKTDTTSIGELVLKTTRFVVKSKTKVATKQTFTGRGNKYKMAKIRVAVYQLPDTNNVIRDSIYNHIERYWIEQEKWLLACPGYEDSINIRGDFRYLPINEGFYLLGTDTVPFIKPNHGRIGTYIIFYFKNNFYKIELLESQGSGGIGFVYQNMIFVDNGKEYPIVDYVSRWMDEIRQIIKEK